MIVLYMQFALFARKGGLIFMGLRMDMVNQLNKIEK